MKWQITSRVCRLIIIVIWIVSFLITLPWAIYFTLAPIDRSPHYQVCKEDWPGAEHDLVFFVVANLILCYLLPLLIISICYILIWIKVWTRKLPGETRDHCMDIMIYKSKIKVVKMLMAVVIMFALSWMPLYAIFLRVKGGGPIGEREMRVVEIAIPLVQWLGASNSCINPILYAFFNKKFRTGFKILLTSSKCCGSFKYDFTYKSSTFRSNSTCASKISKTSNDRKLTLANYTTMTPVWIEMLSPFDGELRGINMKTFFVRSTFNRLFVLKWVSYAQDTPTHTTTGC